MTIIIKEIAVRATIERVTGKAANDERRMLRIKKDVVREMRETFRKERRNQNER